MEPTKHVYACSFCAKTQDRVGHLIAGPGGVYICNECVALCAEIIAEREGKKQEQGTPLEVTLDERVDEVLRRYPDDKDLHTLIRAMVAELASVRQALEKMQAEVAQSPEARAVAETFPSVEETSRAFAAAGFARQRLESVPQVTALSLSAMYHRARERADTTLRGIDDRAFEAGLAALAHAAALETPPAPVVDYLDLLVLR